MQMKLLLVSPAKEIVIPVKMMRAGKRIFHIYRNTLTSLASITPECWDVEIIDESVETIPKKGHWDVVGITVSTCMAERAYELSAEFRRKGSIVVLGGIHPTVCSEEAQKYCDVVVKGEAEYLWNVVLDDIRSGDYRSLYTNESGGSDLVTPRDFPMQSRKLLRGKSLFQGASIQTSRGCPNTCPFCSVPITAGKGLRARDIVDVVNEIKSTRTKRIFILDDNLFENPHFAQFIQEIGVTGVDWYAQLPVNVCRDKNLLVQIGKSGCKGMMIGFDSLSHIWRLKNAIPQDLVDCVQRVHDQGIMVEGSFVFGFDNEDSSVFDVTLDFCKKSKLEAAAFHILTPYPGTNLFSKYQREGRLYIETSNESKFGLRYPWSKYDTAHSVFEPKRMTSNELEDGLIRCILEFYSAPHIIGRLLNSPVWNLSAAAVNTTLAAAFRTGSKYYKERALFREARRTEKYVSEKSEVGSSIKKGGVWTLGSETQAG